MRWCIYLHLAAVAITTLFSLADRERFISPPISEWVEEHFDALLLPAFIAWFACPISAGVISWKRAQRSQKIGYGLLAEAILWVGQWLAFLPMVQ